MFCHFFLVKPYNSSPGEQRQNTQWSSIFVHNTFKKHKIDFSLCKKTKKTNTTYSSNISQITSFLYRIINTIALKIAEYLAPQTSTVKTLHFFHTIYRIGHSLKGSFTQN